MSPRTYRMLADAPLNGKRVLLRAGFDVPVEDGKVTDPARIVSLVPTMKLILEKGAVLILMAHQGRPKDAPDPRFSQKPLVPVLSSLLNTTVHFASDCIGPEAEKAVAAAKPGDIVLLENLRFHPEEKNNDPEFAKNLASLADVYVNDAFTNCHREHASMVGVSALLPSYMGLQLAYEVRHLEPVLHDPTRPLTLIISGAKMETKIPVVKNFIAMGDDILLGGCIANTFIAAQGNDVGTSRYEDEYIPVAKEMMAQSGTGENAAIHVPPDAVVAEQIDGDATAVDAAVNAIGKRMILDIGKKTIADYVAAIEKAKTIIWNGPLGLYENERFSVGTREIASAVAAATKRGALTIIGGGDTIDFHTRYGFPLDAYTFVSTGGGAMLEFLSGEPFASLKALEA